MKTNYILALLALLGGLTAAFTGNSEKSGLYPTWDYKSERMDGEKVKYISASHLADLLYRKEQGMVILDTRTDSEFETYHLPTAVPYHVGWEPDSEKITVVVYGGEQEAKAHALSDVLPGKVVVLKGGLEDWKSLVLFPDFSKYKIRNQEALEHVIRRSSYFGGSPVNNQLLNVDLRQNRYREGC